MGVFIMVPLLVEIQKRIGPVSIDCFFGVYVLYCRQGRREVSTGITYDFASARFRYQDKWYSVDEFRRYIKMWAFS